MQNENETENIEEGTNEGKRKKRCPCVDLRIGTSVDATRNRLDDVKRRLDKRVALSHYEEKGLLPFFLASFLFFLLSFFFISYSVTKVCLMEMVSSRQVSNKKSNLLNDKNEN